MSTPSFDDLSQMSDADLGEVLGHNRELKEFKDGMADIQKLKGKALSDAKSRVEEMLSPHVYSGELRYIARSAKRANQSARQALEDDDPSSMM